MQEQVTIRGGLLREPVVVTCKGPGDQYIELKKGSPWLCESATGQTYSSAPLKRTRLIENLKEVLDAGPDAVAFEDKLSRFSVNSGADALAPTTKRDGKTDKMQKTKVAFEKLASLPGSFGGKVKVSWRLWRPAAAESVWVHRDDIPQAIKYLHTEMKMMGVDEVDTGKEGSDESGSEENWVNERCFWDRRDLAWQGRVTGVDGVKYRITRSVPQKDEAGTPLKPSEFLSRKGEIKEVVQRFLAEKRGE